MEKLPSNLLTDSLSYGNTLSVTMYALCLLS